MRGKLISAEMFLSFPPLFPGDRIRKRKILQLFLFLFPCLLLPPRPRLLRDCRT